MTTLAMDSSRDVYESLQALNWSRLKHLAKSPAHYALACAERTPATPSQRIGIACHAAVLEPSKFSGLPVWRGSQRRGKEWEGFLAELNGADYLTEDEVDTARAVAAAVRDSYMAQQYLEKGRAEVGVAWEADGIARKARLDWLSSSGCVVELKTTADASPRGFATQAARYLYHGQAAWYQQAAKALTGELLPVVFVAVEAAPPYPVTVFSPDEGFMGAGEALVEHLLEEYREVQEAPAVLQQGYATTVVNLSLPAWAEGLSYE